MAGTFGVDVRCGVDDASDVEERGLHGGESGLGWTWHGRMQGATAHLTPHVAVLLTRIKSHNQQSQKQHRIQFKKETHQLVTYSLPVPSQSQTHQTPRPLHFGLPLPPPQTQTHLRYHFP